MCYIIKSEHIDTSPIPLDRKSIHSPCRGALSACRLSPVDTESSASASGAACRASRCCSLLSVARLAPALETASRSCQLPGSCSAGAASLRCPTPAMPQGQRKHESGEAAEAIQEASQALKRS